MVTGTSRGRKITLVGLGGARIPLLLPGVRREGVALREVPSGLTGFSVEHSLVKARGVRGGVWRGLEVDSRRIKLDFIIKAENVVQHVDNLLVALGEGEPVVLEFESAEHGKRWADVRVESVSDPQWHGVPGAVGVCELSVIMVVERPVFRGEVTTHSYQAAAVAGGKMTVPVLGTLPIFPIVTVTGGYTSFKFRLTESVEWQELPQRKEGWWVNTNPAQRAIESLKPRAASEYAGFMPFWPDPAPVKLTSPLAGEATIFVDVVQPLSDFQMTVSVTPEANRAW